MIDHELENEILDNDYKEYDDMMVKANAEADSYFEYLDKKPYKADDYSICEFCGKEVQMVIYPHGAAKYYPSAHFSCPECEKIGSGV